MQQKNMAWSSLKSGIIIGLAMVTLFSAVFFSGNISSLMRPRHLIAAFIENVSGMRPGAPVWFHGIEIGTVESIVVVDSGAIITLSVDKSLAELIKSDTRIAVRTMGLLGDKFVEVLGGSKSSPSATGTDTLRGVAAIAMEEVIASTIASLKTVEQLSRTVESTISHFSQSDGSLQRFIENPDLYENMRIASTRLSSITQQIENSRGTFRMLLDDKELYKNLHSTTEQLTSILSRIESGSGPASTLINNQQMARELETTVTSLRQAIETMGKTAANVDSLVADIREDPGKFFNFSLF